MHVHTDAHTTGFSAKCMQDVLCVAYQLPSCQSGIVTYSCARFRSNAAAACVRCRGATRPHSNHDRAWRAVGSRWATRQLGNTGLNRNSRCSMLCCCCRAHIAFAGQCVCYMRDAEELALMLRLRCSMYQLTISLGRMCKLTPFLQSVLA